MDTYSTIDKFYLAAHLDITRQTVYSEKRGQGLVLANIMIVNCQSDGWWYKDFIGIECFAALRFRKYIGGKYLSDVVAISINNNRVLIGRGFDPDDVIIL